MLRDDKVSERLDKIQEQSQSVEACVACSYIQRMFFVEHGPQTGPCVDGGIFPAVCLLWHVLLGKIKQVEMKGIHCLLGVVSFSNDKPLPC